MPTLCSSRPRPRHRPGQHALIGYEGTYRRAQCEPACQIPADGSLHRDHVRRAGQIDLEVERLEAEGRERTPPRLVKWAVQATRKLKERERPGTLYGRWRAEAAGRGVDPDAVVREVTGRRVGRDQTLSDRIVASVFDQVTRYRVNWRARGLSGGR